MPFSRIFRFLCFFLAISVANSLAATSFGKVRSVIGDVELRNTKFPDGTKPRIGNKIHEGDLIRTMLESEITIGLPDGSAIAIEEKSIVSVAELVSEDGKNISTTDIKEGKIRFDVQKQSSKESSIKFKTGTAVAAIRGTEGMIGTTSGGKLVATLLNGQLEIMMNGKSTTINGGQTAIPNGDEMIVLDLSNSGSSNLYKIIEQILNDTTLTIDSLNKLIIEKNLELDNAVKIAKEMLKCDFPALPDQVSDTAVTIKGKCEAADSVEISGEKHEAKGNEMEFTPNWAIDAIGNKKFSITCQVGPLHIPCGQLSTNYIGIPNVDSTAMKNEQLLTIFTDSPILVSNPAVAIVEGTFSTKDSSATLYVKMGTYSSPNLVPTSVNGQFTHIIDISERKHNWNEKQIIVEYSSKTLGSKTMVLDVDVDKTSKFTNTVAPTLAIRAKDSLKCYIKLDLDDIYEDEVIYSYTIDNETANVSARYKEKAIIQQKLVNGVHKYTFNVTDMAGNSSRITKELGCFPPRKHTIVFDGGSGQQNIRVPSPPQGYSSNVIFKKISFKITNIPDNDPRYIKLITISHKGKKVTLRPSDFQSNIFDYQLELQHGTTTNVTVQVIMKNGSVLTATKSYKVQ